MNSQQKLLCQIFSILAIFSIAIVLGCKDPSSSPVETEVADKVKQRKIQKGRLEKEKDAYQKADYRVLFIGNSHTSTCLMPKTVQQMLNARQAEKKVYCEICASSFLVDHLKRKRTTDLIQNGEWDLVVLQAQKYSMSGTVDYPYDAALELTRMAVDKGAKVVMFPEWGQRKNMSTEQLEKCLAEAERVQKLHEQIVKESGATIVPIGLVWNQALKQHPEWKLHSDGNHANKEGAFLTAAVFQQWIAKEQFHFEPDELATPFVTNENYDVAIDTQKELAKIARHFVYEMPPTK